MLFTQLIDEPTGKKWYDEFITLKIFETKHSEVYVCVCIYIYVYIYKNIHVTYKCIHIF